MTTNDKTFGMTVGGQILSPLPDIEEVTPIPAPKIGYPVVDLWSCRVAPRDKVEIVNPSDVPIDDLLKNLGLLDSPLSGGFGTANHEELTSRREILELMVKCPGLRKWVLRQQFEKLALPIDREEFLTYFFPEGGGQNPYWTLVHEFSRQVRSAEAVTGFKSSRLDQVLSVLESSAALQNAESQMAEVVRERIEHIAAIGGVLSYKAVFERGTLYLQKQQEQVHGYLRFSARLAWLSQLEMPEWDGFWGEVGTNLGVRWIYKLIKEGAIALSRRNAMRAVVIKETPPNFSRDVEDWLKSELQNLLLGFEEGTKSRVGLLHDAVIKVGFKYDNGGLRVTIAGIEPALAREKISSELFDGLASSHYNMGQRRALTSAMNDFDYTFQQNQTQLRLGRLWVDITKIRPNLFQVQYIASPRADRVCKWYAIRNLYQSSPLKAVVKASREHREFFLKHLKKLQEVAQMVEQVATRCQELELPLCVAEPLPEHEHLIEFDGIIPVHLLAKLREDKKSPVPFSLPALNGEMICLTGSHGGGKTTILLSVPTALYMAQSIGLAFGTYFRFNPKRVLAALIINRGSGSTIELILEKTKKILEASERTRPNEMVAVIDELGSATQESAGDKLGRQVLEKLTSRGVSIITATQIQTLAQFAEQRLHAIACKVDRSHQITRGISDGGLEDLCEEMGVTELLRK